MSDPVYLTRKQAVRLLNEIREVASWGHVNPSKAVQELRNELERLAVPLFDPCHGSAHSNPHIDNCSICAPRWGWVGPEVKIR